MPTDVTDPAAVRHLVEATLERFGRVDGLVNNAGSALHGPLAEVDLGEFREVFDLDVVSVVAMTQAVLTAMRAAGRGRIVNIGSGTTRRAMTGVGAYASLKSALDMLSAVWRLELDGTGITVSTASPSITATEFGGGRYRPGEEVRPGIIAHSPVHVAGVVLRVLRTGEDRIDIPHGPERPELTEVPAA